MTPEDLDRQADQAARRYEAALAGFDGIWSRIADFEDPLAPKTRNNLMAQAGGIARTYLEAEERRIEDVFLENAEKSRADASRVFQSAPEHQELTSRITAHLSASGTHLRTELTLQLERDIEAIDIALKKRVFQIDMIMARETISRPEAIVKARIDASRPEYMFRDRAGRRKASQKFVRGVWRHTLMLAMIEVKLMTWSEYGMDVFEVTHEEPTHRFQGKVFQTGTEADVPHYFEVREEIYHPNSRAGVAPRGGSAVVTHR